MLTLEEYYNYEKVSHNAKLTKKRYWRKFSNQKLYLELENARKKKKRLFLHYICFTLHRAERMKRILGKNAFLKLMEHLKLSKCRKTKVKGGLKRWQSFKQTDKN